MSVLHFILAADIDRETADVPSPPALRLVREADGGAGGTALEARQPAEAAVIAAERAIARHEYAEAVAALAGAQPSAAAVPDLALRALLAES